MSKSYRDLAACSSIEYDKSNKILQAHKICRLFEYFMTLKNFIALPYFYCFGVEGLGRETFTCYWKLASSRGFIKGGALRKLTDFEHNFAKLL